MKQPLHCTGFTVFWGGLVGGGGSESLQDTKRPKMQSACKRQDHSAVRPDLALGQTQKRKEKKMTRASVSTKAAVAFYFIFLTPESLPPPSTGLVFSLFNGPGSEKNNNKKKRCDYSNLSALHANTDFSFQQHDRSSHVFTRFPLISAPTNHSRKNKTAKHSAPCTDCAAAR